MAKIILSPITGSYASVTAINARFQQIEDAFNDDVLWRDGFTGEPNAMAKDLDMAGNNLLNVSTIELTNEVSYAAEWANKAEDSLISAAAGGDEVDDYSSLHHSAKANDQRVLAETAKTAAELAETNAEIAQVGAELVLDTFDDRYLGAYPTNPTTDNDGVPLDASDDGIEFWDSTLKVRKTFNGGTLTWGLTSTSVATNAVDVNLADAGTYYPTDNVEAALQDIATPSVAGKGANLLGIEDSGGKYIGTDVETALTELSTTAELGSVSTGEGSSIVGIEDTGGYFTGTDVEAVTQEIGSSLGGLNTKVIDIGDWDMNAIASVQIDLGVQQAFIRSIDVLLRRDDGNLLSHIDNADGTISGYLELTQFFTVGQAVLHRTAAGIFDSGDYNATSYNRGWIVIQYVD